MAKVTVLKTQRQSFTDEERIQLLKDWKESGKTMREFAQSRGLTAASLHQWRERYPNALSTLPIKLVQSTPISDPHASNTQLPTPFTTEDVTTEVEELNTRIMELEQTNREVLDRVKKLTEEIYGYQKTFGRVMFQREMERNPGV